MLISHTHKFIFFKTRKTASTSVENYFVPYCVGPDESFPNIKTNFYESEYGVVGKRQSKFIKKKGLHIHSEFPFVSINKGVIAKWHNHMKAQKIYSYVDTDVWNSYFKFTTIRNPYNKVISAYFFLKNKKNIPLKDPDQEQQLFNNWVLNKNVRSDKGIYFVDGENVLDDVIRVEHIKEDMQRICNRFGISWNPKLLENRKKGTRPKWATASFLFTPESKKMVENIFKYELSHFDYQFPS